MNSFDVLKIFATQLEKSLPAELKAKVVITPSSVKGKGVTLRLSMLKTSLGSKTYADRKTRTVLLRLQVSGTAESMTGLKQAIELIEALDRFLALPGNLVRVTEKGPEAIPNTRIIQSVSQEDSFLANPDSTEVQDVDDNRLITITFQED